MRNYDVIIIGSGINSLSSAALLGKAKKKVLVLEARDTIGGLASTIEFSSGFRCNAINDSIKWINPNLFSELDINSNNLNIIKPNISHIALGDHKNPIFFHRDANKTSESIQNFSAKDATKWDSFISYIKKLTDFLEPLYNSTPPCLPKASIKDLLSMKSMLRPIFKHGTQGTVDLLRAVPMMMPEMMDEWFENELLRGALSTSGICNSSLGPFSASTVYNFLHQHLYSNDVILANNFIDGGTIEFANTLAKTAEFHNVEIQIGSKVESINIENNYSKGVLLKSGEFISSEIVVSGTDPKNTFIKLTGPQKLNPTFLNQLSNIKYRGSVARIHFALKDLPNIKGVAQDEMKTMFSISPSIEYLEKASDSMKYGNIAKNPYLEFCFPSIINNNFAPKGKHILSVTFQYAPYTLRNRVWDKNSKNELKNNTIKGLEKSIPNLTELIEDSLVHSPKDLENEFSLSEGNVNHGEMTLDQFMFMRPTMSCSQYNTPIENLYLCGPGTHPGGGLHGTNALNAVREILQNEL